MKLSDVQGPDTIWNKEGRQESSQLVCSIGKGFREEVSHGENLKFELTYQVCKRIQHRKRHRGVKYDGSFRKFKEIWHWWSIKKRRVNGRRGPWRGQQGLNHGWAYVS